MRGENESPMAVRSNSIKASDGSLTTSLTTSADPDTRDCVSPPPDLTKQLQRRYHKRRSPGGKQRNARHVSTTASEGSENEYTATSTAASTAGSGRASASGSDSDPASRHCYMVITVAGSVSKELDCFQPSHLVSHRVITANGTAVPSCGLPEGWSDTLMQKTQVPTPPPDAVFLRDEQNPPLLPPRHRTTGEHPTSADKPRRSRLTRSNAVDHSPTPQRLCSSNPPSCHSSPDLGKRALPGVRTLPSARLLDERVAECYLTPMCHSKTLPDVLHHSKEEYAVDGAGDPEDEKYVRILSPHSIPSPRFRGTSFLVTCCDKDQPPTPAPRSHLQSHPVVPAPAAGADAQPPPLPPRDTKQPGLDALASGNIINGIHFHNFKQHRVSVITSSELSSSRRSSSLSDLLCPQPVMPDNVRPKLKFSRQRSISATQVTEERRR